MEAYQTKNIHSKPFISDKMGSMNIFDRRNFANKMKHYAILSKVEDDTPRHGTRTPVKYRFDKDNYDRLKRNGFQLEF